MTVVLPVDLGLTVFALPSMGYSFSFIFWTALFCLVGRAAHVYPLTAILNRGPRKNNPITMNQQHMIWYSGLRGAVAFALAKGFPGEKKNEVLATAMVIVLLSIFFMGGGTVAMLDKLKIPRLTVSPAVLDTTAWRIVSTNRICVWHEGGRRTRSGQDSHTAQEHAPSSV
jgi:sodium/hydrogen exchanger 8